MIKFVTGLPGAGKSLRMVELIAAALDGGRKVYVCGLDGLDPALGDWERIESPNDWQDLPDGSLVAIDEAQKFWPQRRSGDPASYIRALSEHRHRGFDFLLVTQHPSMVDKYVRTLCGEHEHVLRQFGTQAAKLITWQECYDDPQSQATRDRGTGKLWRYPKHLYARYKSATLHTVKPRIPLRLKLLPGLLVAAAVLAWYAYGAVGGLSTVDVDQLSSGAVPSDPSVSARAPGAFQPSGTAPKYATVEEYVNAHVPRVASRPWSAPIFDDVAPAASPELYCVSVETGRCVCHTEQGTRYSVTRRECLAAVTQGIYNPYRQKLVSQPPPTGPGYGPGSSVAGSSSAVKAPAYIEDAIPAVRERHVYPPQTRPFR